MCKNEYYFFSIFYKVNKIIMENIMKDEEWKQIILYDDNGEKRVFNYDISTYGNIRSRDTKELLKLGSQHNIPSCTIRYKNNT